MLFQREAPGLRPTGRPLEFLLRPGPRLVRRPNMITVFSRRRIRTQQARTMAIPLGILTGALLAAAIPSAAAQAQAAGQWQLTGSKATGHSNGSNTGFTQLPDGRVLAISGS